MAAFEQVYAPISPVTCTAEKIGVQRYDDSGRVYVHVLNYNYDADADKIQPASEITLRVKAVADKALEIIVPEGQIIPEYSLHSDGDDLTITLKNIGLYTVLSFAQ